MQRSVILYQAYLWKHPTCVPNEIPVAKDKTLYHIDSAIVAVQDRRCQLGIAIPCSSWGSEAIQCWQKMQAPFPYQEEPEPQCYECYRWWEFNYNLHKKSPLVVLLRTLRQLAPNAELKWTKSNGQTGIANEVLLIEDQSTLTDHCRGSIYTAVSHPWKSHGARRIKNGFQISPGARNQISTTAFCIINCYWYSLYDKAW